MSSHLNICNVLSSLENYCEAPLVLDAFVYQHDTAAADWQILAYLAQN